MDEETNVSPDIPVEGTLGLNEFGCVTVDDWLLLAPTDSTAHSDATDDITIKIAGYPDMTLGEKIRVTGQTFEMNIDELRQSAPRVDDCVAADAEDIDVASIGPGAPSPSGS